jgi:hypothetical protein
MIGYIQRLEQLECKIPDELKTDRVLQSLPPSYNGFVLNYNMQGMKKNISELFAMLKIAEIETKKEHQILMVSKTTSFKKKGKKGVPKRVASMLRQLRNTILDLSLNLSASTIKPWVTGSKIVPNTLLKRRRDFSRKVYSIY